jgi:hypothetical protein
MPSLQWGFMTLEKWLAVLTTVVFAYINFRTLQRRSAGAARTRGRPIAEW